jgi:hypothetical protein
MDRIEQEACTRCGHEPVERVTVVEPKDRHPGFVAWMCPVCGAADSLLVYSPTRGTAVGPRRGNVASGSTRPSTIR